MNGESGSGVEPEWTGEGPQRRGPQSVDLMRELTACLQQRQRQHATTAVSRPDAGQSPTYGPPWSIDVSLRQPSYVNTGPRRRHGDDDDDDDYIWPTTRGDEMERDNDDEDDRSSVDDAGDDTLGRVKCHDYINVLTCHR